MNPKTKVVEGMKKDQGEEIGPYLRKGAGRGLLVVLATRSSSDPVSLETFYPSLLFIGPPKVPVIGCQS